jgi:hypothetical protein
VLLCHTWRNCTNVQEKVFMFAAKDVYEDGSMEEFLKEM